VSAYRTLILCVRESAADELLMQLADDDAVQFASASEGVPEYAVAAGADPSGWDE
jgi:hypothetical protein